MSPITTPSTEKTFSVHDASVADHVIRDRMIVPFAAWIASARELLIHSTVDQSLELTDLLVRRQLVITGKTPQAVRFLLHEEDVNGGKFQIVSANSTAERTDEGAIAEGRWRILRSDSDRLSAPSCSTDWTAAEFYEAAHRRGFSYGPACRNVERIEFGEEGWSCKLRRLNNSSWQAGLDAMLQGGAVLASSDEVRSWIPYRIDQVRLNEHVFNDSSDGAIVGRWLKAGANERVAQIDWIDPRSGQFVAALRGVHYRPATAQDSPAPATKPASVTELTKPASDGTHSLLDRLRAANAGSRQEILASEIEEYVLQLLKWNESKRKDLSRGFVAIGLDSLLAVDLQFRLQTELKFSLPPGTGLNQPTIAELAVFLLNQHSEFRS